MGRGGKSNAFSGNKNYHWIKLKFYDEYSSASEDAEKTHIAQSFVNAIEALGGHFLEKDDKGWYKVHNHIARTKASQALRDYKPEKDHNSTSQGEANEEET